MEALEQATIKVVAVIAEGVPERDAKKLIAYARANSKVLIGPATVGGVQVRGRAGARAPEWRGFPGRVCCCRARTRVQPVALWSGRAPEPYCTRSPAQRQVSKLTCSVPLAPLNAPQTRPAPPKGRRLQDRRHRRHPGQHHRLQAVPPRQRGVRVQERRDVQRNVQRAVPRHGRAVRGWDARARVWGGEEGGRPALWCVCACGRVPLRMRARTRTRREERAGGLARARPPRARVRSPPNEGPLLGQTPAARTCPANAPRGPAAGTRAAPARRSNAPRQLAA